MPPLAVVVLLGLASFRLTRLFAADTITVALRDRLYRFAYDDTDPEKMLAYARSIDAEQGMVAVPKAAWRTWAYALWTCQWCLGVWISIAVYCAWRWGGDVALAVITIAAVAGAQGALAQFAGGSEDD